MSEVQVDSPQPMINNARQPASASPPSVEEYANAAVRSGVQASGTDELEFDFGGHSDGEPLDGDAEGQAGGGNVNSALATSKLSTKKKEALSQVPCKFFRSNGCSAGNACPFAHIQPGEGQGKAICQWFLKGNCRFGHRCALAHILPGQPMSMDRKNKRAQQQQQTGTNGGHHQVSGAAASGHAKRPSQPHHFSGLSRELAGGAANGHFGALPSYALARDGGGNGGGDLMFGTLDDLQYPGGATSASVHQMRRPADWQTPSRRSQQDNGASFDGIPLPTSMAVGSPMNAQVFGTSPFSQPGSHSVFFSGSQKDTDRAFGHSHPRNEEDEALRRAAQRSWGNEEENAEEFLPSSLSDLLTPAELERRRRSVLGSKNQWLSQRASSSALGGGGGIASQSVPATSSGMAKGEDQSEMENENLWNRSSTNLDAGIWNGSGAQTGSRLGASNTSAGFFISRIGDPSSSTENRLDADAQRSFNSYSPDVRAALSHAPGQSLPQGLAAGLSRLHLRSDAANSSMTHSRLAGDVPLQHGMESTIPSSSSPGVIGGQRVGQLDDLAPVAPSSIFAHRGTPLHQQFGRSMANSSVSASFDAQPTSQFKNGNNFGFSPLTGGIGQHSPALRAEQGGIAIPNGNTTAIGGGGETGSTAAATTTTTTSTTGHSSSFTNNNGVGPIGLPLHHKHPGLHRVRAGAGSSGAGIGASPLALPTTGEEVEEAIFELE